MLLFSFPSLDRLDKLGSVVGGIIAVIALIIAWFQILHYYTQKRNDGLVQAFTLLQQQDIRVARRYTLGKLAKIPYREWKKKDRDIAEDAAQAFETVAYMVAHRVVSRNIATVWERTYQRVWCIIQPMVAEYRVKRNPKFLFNFESYLINKAPLPKEPRYSLRSFFCPWREPNNFAANG